MGIFSKKTKEEKRRTPPAKDGGGAPLKESPADHGTAGKGSVVRVLIAPHVSEKARALEPAGTYTFLVRDEANKALVAEEVARRYRVKVVRVRMVRNRGARRFFRGRWYEGKITKKALVTVAPGSKIEFQ